MAFCTKCGAQISEGSAFCGKCGAPVNPSVKSPASASSAAPSTPQVSPAAPTLPQPAATATPTSPNILVPKGPPTGRVASPAAPPGASTSEVSVAKKPGSLLLKVVLGVLGLFTLITVLVIGGCVYIGYRVKKRVNQFQQAYKHDDVAGMVAAVNGKSGGSKGPQTLPKWKSAPPDLASAPSSHIPLSVGLRLVAAGNERLRGDFESILTIDSVTAQDVHIKGSEEFPNAPSLSLPFGSGKSQALAKKIRCGRTVLRRDLENSAESSVVCWNGEENTYPGTTAIGLSKATFKELKTTGEAPFTDHEDPMKELFSNFKRLASGSGDSSQLLTQLMSMAPGSTPPPTPPIHCTLHRVGTSDVAFPVMINDKETILPAMHIQWKRSDTDQENDYILDDPNNPLVLAYQSESEGIGQVIRIYLPEKPSTKAGGSGSGGGAGAAGSGSGAGVGGGGGGGGGGGSGQATEAGAHRLEQELEKSGRAKIYDIYFDFASATLRPESKKVLDEISIVMHDHPDWKLSVEGHTDNIGGDAYNLNLSKRRAAAVKQALVSGYHVDPGRLSTAGFGDTRPVATNDTMEGRALNRRVELARE